MFLMLDLLPIRVSAMRATSSFLATADTSAADRSAARPVLPHICSVGLARSVRNRIKNHTFTFHYLDAFAILSTSSLLFTEKLVESSFAAATISFASASEAVVLLLKDPWNPASARFLRDSSTFFSGATSTETV